MTKRISVMVWTAAAAATALGAVIMQARGQVITSAPAAAPTVTASIDASKIGAPISKYLYGQFIEHLGGVINTGIWAEMLDDRKFYFPVVAPATASAPARGGRGAGGFRGALRRWNPIGPAEAVTMDTASPYVGDHTPLVKLDGAGPHGIRQGGLVVVKGKSYTGRVVVAGDASAKISVSLVWGGGAADAGGRQTVELPALRPVYAKLPVNFTAGADASDAAFEITGTGTGAFHVGAVSLMPADNVKGYRPEIIALLKSLRSGVYRFPGGNFVSDHDWHDSIGDPDKRPPRMDFAWNAVQPNDVGIDEFMDLCGLLEVDPYITVNAGFGDAHSAAEQVEYANGAATTPLGARRAAGGHSQPYNIKLWGIGNEMYGDWQLGMIKLTDFEKKHNMFAKAMKAVDPSIKLVASGAMPDEMTVTLQGRRINQKVLTEIGSPADWTGGLLANCLDNVDLISEHCYCNNNQHFDMERAAYATVDDSMPEYARRMANRVRAKYEAYEEYAKRMPAFAAKRPPISLDEWSYGRQQPSPNTYRVAPGEAWALNEMFRHSDVFQMAAFTFATSCLSADRAGHVVLNPTGLVFKMYRDHFGVLPVEVTGNSPQPGPKYPVGGDQPAVNAGSPTFPLDVCAAWSADKKTLTVAVVNPMDTPQHLDLTFKGVTLTGPGKLWRLAPSDFNAMIVIGQEPGVKIEEQASIAPGALTVAPISVNIYEWPVK